MKQKIIAGTFRFIDSIFCHEAKEQTEKKENEPSII